MHAVHHEMGDAWLCKAVGWIFIVACFQEE